MLIKECSFWVICFRHGPFQSTFLAAVSTCMGAGTKSPVNPNNGLPEGSVAVGPRGGLWSKDDMPMVLTNGRKKKTSHQYGGPTGYPLREVDSLMLDTITRGSEVLQGCLDGGAGFNFQGRRRLVVQC